MANKLHDNFEFEGPYESKKPIKVERALYCVPLF